jgi:hypothetical protein
MSEGEDDPFAKEYERNTKLEHLSAGVLVLGLAAELVNAAIWFEGKRTVAEMFATALIVFGVAGEVWFANRARMAGDKQLAQFRMRTAEANQTAQEAILELARFREPRTFTNEQMYRIAEKLKPYAGIQFAGATTGRDPEHRDFLQYIEVALMLAGWKEIDWNTSVSIGRSSGRTSIGANVSVSDILITTPLSLMGSDVEKAVLALAETLTEEGFKARAGLDSGPQSTTIHVMVGPKT